MRIQPMYASSTRQTRFPPEAGRPRPGARQWEMRNSDGSMWTTKGHYTRDEIAQFVCAEPWPPLVGGKLG